MTYAGVLKDELNEIIEKNRNHGDIKDIVFLHTYLMLDQEWTANRLESTFTMERSQQTTPNDTMIYIDKLTIDNSRFTLTISQRDRCNRWAGGLFVVKLTLKGSRYTRFYGNEIEVIVNSLDDMILGITQAINGDLEVLSTLLISCARGERRMDFYKRVRYGPWGFPAGLGMNDVDPWSYRITGEEEMLSTLSDLEWELAGVMIRKMGNAPNKSIVTARTMVKTLGEDECRKLLDGDYEILRRKCIDIRYHQVGKEHDFDDNDLDAAETDTSSLSTRTFD